MQNNDEFQSLKEFGHTIKKTNGKVTIKKEEKVIKKKKIFIKSIKKFLKIIFSNILKISIKIGGFLRKKIEVNTKNIHLKILKWKYIHFSSKIKKKGKKIGYRIVETTKQKGNKIIITRKRIPFNYEILNLQRKYPNVGKMFYLSIKGDEKEPIETKPETYTRIKESVWDFKIKNEKDES